METDKITDINIVATESLRSENHPLSHLHIQVCRYIENQQQIINFINIERQINLRRYTSVDEEQRNE